MSRCHAKISRLGRVAASILAAALLSGCARLKPAPAPPSSRAEPVPAEPAPETAEAEPAKTDPELSTLRLEAETLRERVADLTKRNERLAAQLAATERLYREAELRVDELEQTSMEKVVREEERIQELEQHQRDLQEQRKTTQHLSHRLGGLSKQLQDLRNQFAAMQTERRVEAARYQKTIRELRDKLEQRGVEQAPP